MNQYSVLLLSLLLAGCGGQAKQIEPVAECAERFMKAMPEVEAFAGEQVRAAYLFELKTPEAQKYAAQGGVEGVEPTNIHAFQGNRAEVRALDEARQAMGGAWSPGGELYLASKSYYLYRPNRLMAKAQASQHLSAMCSFDTKGLSLASYSVLAGNKTSKVDLN